MSIRKLALTVAVIIGVLEFAGKANAQVIYTSGYYSTPVVYTSYYAPTYTDTPGVTYSSSWYTPTYTGYWGGYPYSYTYPTYTEYYTTYPTYSSRRPLLGWRRW